MGNTPKIPNFKKTQHFRNLQWQEPSKLQGRPPQAKPPRKPWLRRQLGRPRQLVEVSRRESASDPGPSLSERSRNTKSRPTSSFSSSHSKDWSERSLKTSTLS